MGSNKAHVISALKCLMMSDEYDYLAADQCRESKKKVACPMKTVKIRIICYYGGEIEVKIGVKVARSLMGNQK